MKPIDVKETMREIRARIRRRNSQFAQQNNVPTHATPGDLDWTRLYEADSVLETEHSRIGELPDEPPTIRGRVGSFLVKVVRRALFWYTPQIVRFHVVVVHSFKALLAALETVAKV